MEIRLRPKAVLAELVRQSFPRPLRKPSLLGLRSWEGLSAEAVEERTKEFVRKSRSKSSASKFRTDSRVEVQRLRLENNAAEAAFAKFAEIPFDAIINKFPIQPSQLLPKSFEKSFIHIKLNHGFWEQFLTSKLEAPLASQVGDWYAQKKSSIDRKLTNSGFSAALELISLAESPLAISPKCQVEIGFSLNNGDFFHADWSNQLANSAEAQRRTRAVAAGYEVFFRGSRLVDGFSLVDGASAKQALYRNDLSEIIRVLQETTEHIVFVASRNLRDIRLSTEPRAGQETIFISTQRSISGWVPSLQGVSTPIFGRLQAGQNVLVLAQAGGFAALLGLYLQHLISLSNVPGKLFYIDLGQAMDVTRNGIVRGSWVNSLPSSELKRLKRNSPFIVSGRD